MDSGTNLTQFYATEEVAAVVDPRSPSWSAIFAGTVAGLAVHLLLMMLGAAAGAGRLEPVTDENPVATFSVGTALIWTVSALISLWTGGWVAGRCAARVHSVSGATHGFLVWCVATVAAFLLIAGGAGMLIGGATNVAGQALAAMGRPAANGGAEIAREAARQHGTTVASFIDEAVAAPGANAQPGGNIVARREIGQAVRRLFADGADFHDAGNRAAVVRALVDNARITETEANQMVDRWIAAMDRLRNEAQKAQSIAEAKARDAAERATHAVSQAAWWSFIGFVLGALVSTWGGRSGARWEYRHHTATVADPDEGAARSRRTELPGRA